MKIDEHNLLEGYIIEKETVGDGPWKWELGYEILPSDGDNRLMRLVRILGNDQLSVIELTEEIGLKDRVELFNAFYLTPAIQAGLVRRLVSEHLQQSQQKYQLTAKGLGLYNKMS